MAPTRSDIEALVVRIQAEFLQAPAVRLTLDQIARRLHASAGLCKAVLRVLVDARVLAEAPGGMYARFFPHATAPSRAARIHAA
jgi:hypothetical protein